MSQFARPALNDFMQFSYMTYFGYLVLLPALLYARRETRAFWTVMTATALAHYTVYTVAAVSYTHLDVYKRQAVALFRFSGADVRLGLAAVLVTILTITGWAGWICGKAQGHGYGAGCAV